MTRHFYGICLATGRPDKTWMQLAFLAPAHIRDAAPYAFDNREDAEQAADTLPEIAHLPIEVKIIKELAQA